jgi:hypothetical protein
MDVIFVAVIIDLELGVLDNVQVQVVQEYFLCELRKPLAQEELTHHPA